MGSVQSRTPTPTPASMAALPCLVPDMPSTLDLHPYLRSIDESGRYTDFGPLVRKFESRLARVLRRRDSFPGAIGVCSTSSGTMALELGLAALQLKPRARVLIPAVTFPSTATAVLRAGHIPVLADVDPDRWILTPTIAQVLHEKIPIDAVIPVAAFGPALETEAWDAFSAKTEVPVLIDAAPAYPDQTVGERCLVAFSFHATKALGVGEGGALVSRDQLLTARVQCLSDFGYLDGRIQTPGTNAKMSEYHAAVGLAQLDRWPGIVQRRQTVWRFYEELLQEALHERVVRQKGVPSSAPGMMVAAVPELPARRVLDRLQMRGIQGRRWYCPALHLHAGIRERSKLATDRLPTADFLSDHLLGLPFHTGLTREDVSAVVRKLSAAIEDAAQ